MNGKDTLAELSGRAVALGMLLGLLLTAANTYLGLYAGLTVSASIPAAIISMGLLRTLFKGGTILENNIVQTMASAGESVAAGIIFTVPALVITQVWTDFSYWKVTAIALLGGVLGVLFMIPLRRTLIVEDKELIYPEGVAAANVLQTGESGGRDLVAVFVTLGAGAVFKALSAMVGVLQPALEVGTRVGRSLAYFGCDISLALLGVGVIVGLEVGVLVFAGGAIGWLIGIPLYYLYAPMPEEMSAVEAAGAAWNSQIRYMGVGAMIVGGLSSMWGIRSGIGKGLQQTVSGLQEAASHAVERTDRDLPSRWTMTILVLAAVSTVGLYRILTGDWPTALTAGVLMVAAAFFFVAVSSYIVGLVGSSNNPVSGMTICALLFSSVVLLAFGMSGDRGVIAVLGVAGVVCCAAATAGDTSQDLKTGFMVGATPWRQQVAQFAGVIVPAFIIAPVLTILHTGPGIGTGEEGSLPAPQASLFAAISRALFQDSGDIPWVMVGIGAGIGVALLTFNAVLDARDHRRADGSKGFRAHVMPVAVGIYLPMALSVPIFFGGLLHYGLTKHGSKATRRAMLIGSGLIAGEAVAGILIAVLASWKQDLFPIPVLDSELFTLVVFLAAAWMIFSSARKAADEPSS